MISKIIHYAKFPYIGGKHTRLKNFFLLGLYLSGPLSIIILTASFIWEFLIVNYDTYAYRDFYNYLEEVSIILLITIGIILFFASVSYILEPYFKKDKGA